MNLKDGGRLNPPGRGALTVWPSRTVLWTSMGMDAVDLTTAEALAKATRLSSMPLEPTT